MKKKIYLAPSNQRSNPYSYGKTNEAEQCIAIAKSIQVMLKDYDCECKLGEEKKTIQNKAKEANEWGADVYLSIHSNAGGGKGTEVWYNPNKKGSKDFANAIYKKISAISPGKDRGLKSSTEYLDVNRPNMTCCLCEMEFHDWEDGAKWIVNNRETIARNFVNALVDYLKISKKEVKETTTTTQTIKVGDTVSLTLTATYYNGGSIPLWVKAKKWIVKEVKGDRVVIDKSSDGKNAICSPVNIKYLKLYKKEVKETTTTQTIKVGDTVSLTLTATYYNGTSIPLWVKAKKWIVKEVKGDRVVIDKSSDGKNAICSPVNIKYLKLYKSK